MRIDAANLPAPAEIDHPEIRAAAEKYTAATQALRDQQRAVAKLDDDDVREQYLERDAEDAEAALAAGKPAPRRRHAAEHAKKLDGAEHQVRVARLAAQRSLRDFQAVVDEYAAAWAESIDSRTADLDRAWCDAVAALEAVHRERVGLSLRRKVVGGTAPSIGALRLRPSQLYDATTGDRLPLAYLPDPDQRHRQRAHIRVEDALAALRNLGGLEEPEPYERFDLGAALKPAIEQARTVERGFGIGEENAPAVRQIPRSIVTPDGATFHAPDSEAAETV